MVERVELKYWIKSEREKKRRNKLTHTPGSYKFKHMMFVDAELPKTHHKHKK